MKDILTQKGLVIATHNAGKLREIQALLAPLGIQCSSAADHQLPEPEETGKSFIENAMLKSAAAFRATNIPSLSDDSGLVIPAIGGQPGIYSARWAEQDGVRDFQFAFERVKRELQENDAPLDAQCYFVCVLSLALPKQEQVVLDNNDSDAFTLSVVEQGDMAFYNMEGRVYGTLNFPPRGTQGFGYDPIFIPEGMEQTFAEISASEKQAMSHRAHAFDGFLKIIG